MQYLLTEVEFRELNQLAESGIKSPTKDELQKFCTRVADEMPIRWTWGEGQLTPKPWGCILTATHEWYCDQCPAKDLCPHEHKEWSK